MPPQELFPSVIQQNAKWHQPHGIPKKQVPPRQQQCGHRQHHGTHSEGGSDHRQYGSTCCELTGSGEELKPFDHFGYEAAQVIFAAMERAGGPDRTKVIEELKKTKYTGVLGTTTFDDKGDTLNKIVTMTRARAKDRTFPSVK